MKPILFNSEMVKAILDGRKTVTRRTMNRDVINGCDIDVDGTLLKYENCYGDFIDPIALCRFRKGDVLYVRETWCKLWKLDSNEQIIEGTDNYYYAADGYNPTPFNSFPDADGFCGDRDRPKWKPSIHMPKEAARIFLKVTDVRVERLQDMSEQDAIKEGVEFDYNPGFAFMILWDSTIKKADLDKCGWNANPWVWVIEFERCEKPESEEAK